MLTFSQQINKTHSFQRVGTVWLSVLSTYDFNAINTNIWKADMKKSLHCNRLLWNGLNTGWIKSSKLSLYEGTG